MMQSIESALTGPASASPAASTDSWVSTSGGHALYVRVVEPERAPQSSPALLCLHGLFSDGRFFLSSKGEGPGRFFLQKGYRLLLADLRGHGKSRWPGGGKRWNWNFDTYAREDVADLLEAVRRMHRGPLFLLCHSMGGYVALAGLAVRPEMQAYLRGICLLAVAVNDYGDGGLSKRLIIPFSSLVAGMLGRLPAVRLKMGTSDEPAELMKQIAHWASTRSFCSYDRSTDYWQMLKNVEMPVFAGIGAADRFHASPRRAEKLLRHLGSTKKEFIVFGRANGFEVDYRHLDILRGEPAQREVLPRLHDWMRGLIAPPN